MDDRDLKRIDPKGLPMIACARGRLSLAAWACAALAVLWLAGCAPDSTSVPPVSVGHFQSAAAIWFHPKPFTATGPSVGGSTDFLALFHANAQWPRAMAKTQVVGLYAGWVVGAGDQELQQIVSFLHAYNIGIELEAPALQALATCGSGVEGYVPYGQSVYDFTLAYLQRLNGLGAQVLFVKIDEPYYFGAVVNDPRSCHFSVTEVASEVEQYVQLVKTVYPNVAVGDIEPIIASAYMPDVVTAIGQWQDTYRAVSGAPLPFFFADADFGNPAWPTLVKRLEDQTRQHGMRFGILYTGDFQDVSDAEWTAKAVARFQTYQGANGGQPDYVLFQSWEPHPQFCLPERDPTTFTGVIDAYISATTTPK